MNYSDYSPFRDSDSLAKIDETLARSRKIVQDSIELSRRTGTVRKPEEFSPYATPARYNLPAVRHSSPLCHNTYEEQILELTEKLHNEEYLKTSYENALKDLRDRLAEIERKETEKADQHQRLLKEQKEAFDRREQFLLEKIDEMERVNRQLQDQASRYLGRDKENKPRSPSPATHSRVKKLEAEVKKYKKVADLVPKLESELKALNTRYWNESKQTHELEAKLTQQTDYEKLMQDNSAKLVELETKLKQTTQKYSILANAVNAKKRKINKSQQGKRKTAKSAASKRASACHSPFGNKRTKKL